MLAPALIHYAGSIRIGLYDIRMPRAPPEELQRRCEASISKN